MSNDQKDLIEKELILLKVAVAKSVDQVKAAQDLAERAITKLEQQVRLRWYWTLAVIVNQSVCLVLGFLIGYSWRP